MGAGVSTWYLARTVSKLGHLGVVSGTAIDLIMARRLQDGDPGGHIRRSLDSFPFPAMAKRFLDTFFIEGGKAEGKPYRAFPMQTKEGPRKVREYCIVANFAEVFLAKEGHDGDVAINYLEKIQMPHLASIYGAMLAGVSAVIMGAGIPREIPGIIDAYVNHAPASYPLYIADASPGQDNRMRFDPREYMEVDLPPLSRPDFLPIISSNTLALHLFKKSTGRIQGFVVEGPTAGGHNAPPRGQLKLNERGEPIYGPRDVVDLNQLAELGLPFWIAGSCGKPERLLEMLRSGATGIQVGTAFAFCNESGYPKEFKAELIRKALAGEADIFTDPIASPTGFPFKVATLEGTISSDEIYRQRNRICDLGYLREAYQGEGGAIGYRCASEPIDDYLRKGGEIDATKGRKCLCNALMANIGHAQLRKDGYKELPLITCGDELLQLERYFPKKTVPSYSAADVIDYLTSGLDEEQTARRTAEPALV